MSEPVWPQEHNRVRGIVRHQKLYLIVLWPYFERSKISQSLSMMCFLTLLLLNLSFALLAAEGSVKGQDTSVISKEDIDFPERFKAVLSFDSRQNTFGKPGSNRNRFWPRSSGDQQETISNGLQVYMANERKKQGLAHLRREAATRAASEAADRIRKVSEESKNTNEPWDEAIRFHDALEKGGDADESMRDHRKTIETLGLINKDMYRRMKKHALPVLKANRRLGAGSRRRRQRPRNTERRVLPNRRGASREVMRDAGAKKAGSRRAKTDMRSQ